MEKIEREFLIMEVRAWATLAEVNVSQKTFRKSDADLREVISCLMDVYRLNSILQMRFNHPKTTHIPLN